MVCKHHQFSCQSNLLHSDHHQQVLLWWIECSAAKLNIIPLYDTFHMHQIKMQNRRQCLQLRFQSRTSKNTALRHADTSQYMLLKLTIYNTSCHWHFCVLWCSSMLVAWNQDSFKVTPVSLLKVTVLQEQMGWKIQPLVTPLSDDVPRNSL